MTRPLPAPDPPPPRRTEDPLPPYRYVPGFGPHPLRHPDGHRYPTEAPGDPLRLAYDLVDHRYYWEAHEVLEALWHETPRGTPRSELLQSLIQACAFALRRHTGHEQAADRLLRRSLERLEQVRTQTGAVFLEIDLDRWAERLRAFAAGGPWPLLATPEPR